jgi:hypothetical protein
LITPDAAPRACAGSCCAAAPINTEKLPTPEPIAASKPRVTVRPKPELTHGVSAQPSARVSTPTHSTPRGPWRSASAPASG